MKRTTGPQPAFPRSLAILSSVLCVCMAGAAQPAGASNSPSTSATISVEDARGRTVNLPKPPERIASATVGSDEILIELLTRTDGLNRLVAVSKYATSSKYSNVTETAEKVDGRVGRGLEPLVKQKPDLVVLAGYNGADLIHRLEQLDVPTFVLGKFQSFSDIHENTETLGRLIGSPSAGKKLAGEFRERLRHFRKSRPPKKKRPKVLGYFGGRTVYGKETTFQDIVTTAGARNLAAQADVKGWTKLSAEALAAMDPDYIVAAGGAKDREKIVTKLQSTEGWKQQKAVQKGRVIVIPRKDLSSVSHHVLTAVKALREHLHATPKPKSKTAHSGSSSKTP